MRSRPAAPARSRSTAAGRPGGRAARVRRDHQGRMLVPNLASKTSIGLPFSAAQTRIALGF